jgi:WD40 repeat protein
LESGENDVRRLGKETDKRGENPVRLLYFEDEARLLSVARDGRALLWDLGRPAGAAVDRFRFFADQERAPDLYRVAVSADGKWLAAAGWHPRIEIRSRDGRNARPPIVLAERAELPTRVPRSLAFHPRGERLAVGIRTIDRNDFFHGTNDEVRIFDLASQPPKSVSGPTCSYHAEALAFHPDGKSLAMAGGDDHEVSLWDMAGKRIGEAIAGPGRCLWGVRLSKDNRYLAVQERRSLQPKVNERGSGAWRVFDLNRRRWAPADAEFQPTPIRETAGGWSVTFPPTNVFQWSVMSPDGKAFPLNFDENVGGEPLCYTFLEADGKRPVRLAVGQYYGSVSIFELGDRDPRGLQKDSSGTRVMPAKVFTVHQGEVMSIAPSADQRWLVTASRDQTVAALGVAAEWSSGNELGAQFILDQGRLVVRAVDKGSPAWEAGLTEGDEIRLLAFDGNLIYNRTAEYGGEKGAGDKCIERLSRPVPGKELYFLLQRAGQPELVKTNSKSYRRPQWRFLPTRDRDWVLWLWRSYYYDTSTHGDYLIGWHVNQGVPWLQEKPDYYPAEKLRAVYHRPDLTHRLLWEPKVESELGALVRIRPPRVAMEIAAGGEAGAEAITVTVRARAQEADNPDQQLKKAELWVEDYRYATWDATGKAFAQTVSIPMSALRSGTNQLTFQCTNAAGGTDETAVKATGIDRKELPDLYGLVVGVGDYQNAVGPEGRPQDLRHTVNDATEIRAAWIRQSGKRYQNAEVTLLYDTKATKQAVLDDLKSLQKRVRPDDLLVLYLGGHGYDYSAKGRRGGADQFVFCCPNFDVARPEETGITSQTLYEQLADLRCRKLVLLDVCHAGLAANPVRGLTPGGKGPTILASCDKTEAAVEDDSLKHGLFTYALVEALGRSFDTADRDKDQKLDANELFTYSEERLPQLLKDLKREESQNPTRFPKEPDRFPLAVK